MKFSYCETLVVCFVAAEEGAAGYLGIQIWFRSFFGNGIANNSNSSRYIIVMHQIMF